MVLNKWEVLGAKIENAIEEGKRYIVLRGVLSPNVSLMTSGFV